LVAPQDRALRLADWLVATAPVGSAARVSVVIEVVTAPTGADDVRANVADTTTPTHRAYEWEDTS
jgi:hypothetical protein